MKFPLYLSLPMAAAAALTATSLFAADFGNFQSRPATASATEDPDKDYDRLDGTGASGKTVNVIEWEGNLEIHVLPAGSLKGLALKIDRAQKDKPVMVIGYRFDNDPSKQLVRRAILSIDLKDEFKTFRDPSATAGTDGYDKIVISNNGLSSQMVAYALDPAPAQLYPDGHPALQKQLAETAPDTARQPASKKSKKKIAKPVSDEEDSEGSVDMPDSQSDGDGTIKPFMFK